MQLNELVKNYSLNTVSQKTNISVEVLEKLVNKEWDKLQKTKVNGFLQIIEREFDIDLSDIKQEAKEYYKDQKLEQPQRPIDLVDAEVDSRSTKRVVTNLLTIVIVALAAYSAWYYLAKQQDTNDSSSDTNSSGMFQDSIDAAKELIGVNNKKVLESNETNKSNKQEKLISKDLENNKTSLKEDIQESNISKKFDISIPNANNNNSNKEEFNINTQEQNSNKTLESNKTEDSLEHNITSVDLKNSSKSAIKSDSLDLNSSIKSQEQNNSNNINVKLEQIEQNNTQTQEDNATLNKDKNNSSSQEGVDVILDENLTSYKNNATNLDTSITPSSVTITPTVKKIWIGIYNLKTKKRVVKVATNSYDYNTNNGDVAIVTGHGMFKIATSNGNNKEFKIKNKKKYLLINKDGIKELTKQEYKKVTKRRAW